MKEQNSLRIRARNWQKKSYLNKVKAHSLHSLNRLLDPFVILQAVRDPQGKIVDLRFQYGNQAALEMITCQDEQVLGVSWMQIAPEPVTRSLFDYYCQVVETGQPLVLDDFALEDSLAGKDPRRVIDLRATRQGDGLAVTWRDLTRRKQVESELSEVQTRLGERIEDERRKLASKLHDGPVQDLYALDYQLHGLALDLNETHTNEKLKEVQVLLHQVIDVLLDTVGDLRPTSLAPFGLTAAILSHIHRYKERHPETKVQLDLDEDGQLLTEGLRLGLYRIYQEILRNIEHHANASYLAINLHLSAKQVCLVIEDNGIGFAVPERLVTLVRLGHYGLASIQEQAQRLGGEASITSQLNEGTRVTVCVPIAGSNNGKNGNGHSSR